MSIPASRDTQLKRARLYPDVTRLSLDDARICLNCDTIHDGDSCPVCASVNFLILSSVLGRLSHNSRFQYDGTPVHVPDRVIFANGRQLKSVSGR